MSVIALTKVVQLAEAVSSGLLPTPGTAGTPLRKDPELDPATVLFDLRLPPSLLEMLTPALTLLGFQCDEQTLQDKAGLGDKRQVHRCRMNGLPEMYLAHIPKWILERNSQQDRQAVDYLRHSFLKIGRVYIISEGVDALRGPLKVLLSIWREQAKINAFFISWILLKDLQTDTSTNQTLTPELRQGYLKSIFELDGAGPMDAPQLSDSEKKSLIAMLMNQALTSKLGVKDFFVDLIKNMNLPPFWEAQRVGAVVGNPETDANDLLTWAEAQKTNTNPGRESYTVLGELAERLMEFVGGPDRKTLRSWMIGKPLILDQAAREAFSTKYPGA